MAKNISKNREKTGQENLGIYQKAKTRKTTYNLRIVPATDKALFGAFAVLRPLPRCLTHQFANPARVSPTWTWPGNACSLASFFFARIFLQLVC